LLDSLLQERREGTITSAMYATSKTRRHIKSHSTTQTPDVSEEYQVAEYDPMIVKKQLTFYRTTPLQQLVHFWKNPSMNIIGQTWYFLLLFLVLYYIIQIAYQFDLFCPNGKRIETHLANQSDACTIRTQAYINHWDLYEKDFTKLITFLLGFYVSTIAKRWWDQVGRLPDADTLGLVLGGLVWAGADPDQSAKEVSLEFRKTILRYAHLSWTMCLSRISQPLRNNFMTSEAYIEKKLLMRTEADQLQMDSDSRDYTSQWWIPLSWAVSMANDASNNKFKGKKPLIPKDHKDVVGALFKFQKDLFHLAEYRLKPMPAIYEQAVWVALWMWVVMGTISSQNTVHHIETGRYLAFTLVMNFPIQRLLMYMLVFAWLRVADILSNPFGNDEGYDISLSDTLDFNLWRSALTIESQEQASYTPLIEALQY